MNEFLPIDEEYLRKWPWLPPEFASPEGIVGVGGELNPTTLLSAYSNGIFPWFNEGDPVIWWSPDPRAVIPLETFHIPKRLKSKLNNHGFRITVNTAFADVIRACGELRDDGSWITEDVIQAYTELHECGHAHSLEVWQGPELAGGIYGVAVGGLFSGESMFYRITDASKIALISLLQRLKLRGYTLFDSQIINDHTARFGAIEIPRTSYLRQLNRALANAQITFG